MNPMGEKIKNLFFKFTWERKQLILAVLFFSIFFGLCFPFHSVQAGIVSGFLGALASLPVAIITVILQVVLLATNLFVSLAGAILWWVISPYFTSMPYTYGGIVDVGWPIIRDFTNMLFVIALVVIGLATALRIQEYQAQKALPLLIIIAILINFTPVICGVIIDAANIFMNFFLKEITGLRVLINVFSQQGSLLGEMFSHPFDIRYAAAALGKTIGLITFGFIATFVFLMYAILFIMRYIMVWILVIVSPLAFFSRIFPGSQKYLFKSILGWDEWWKQFIEWSLVGVVGAFFLYLAEQLMILAPDFIPGVYPEGVAGTIATPLIDFINNLLPYGVVLGFLIIGFLTATSTSAMGATFVTKMAKRSMTAMRREGAALALAGLRATPGLVRGAIGKAAEGMDRFAATHPRAGRIIGPTAGAFKWALEKEKWVREKAGKVARRAVPAPARRGLRRAWEAAGRPIYEAGWEPMRREIFGPEKLKKEEWPSIRDEEKPETEEEWEALKGRYRDYWPEIDDASFPADEDAWRGPEGVVAKYEKARAEAAEKAAAPPPEKKEKAPPAAPPSIEEADQPLAVKIRKAERWTEKHILERARDRFPEKFRDTLSGSAVADLDKDIENLEKEKRQKEEEIDRMKRIEKAPEAVIWRHRVAAGAIQSQIDKKKEDREKAMDEWRAAITPWREKHPEMTAAQEITRLKEMETMTKGELDKMTMSQGMTEEELTKKGMSRASKEDIKKTKRELKHIKEAKRHWEGELALHSRGEKLKGEVEKARGREQEIRQGLTKTRGEINRIKGEAAELTKKREETDRQLYSLEEELGKVSSNIEGRTTHLSELKKEQSELQKEKKGREAKIKELQQEKEDLRKSGLPREQRRQQIQGINSQIDTERASLSVLRTKLNKDRRTAEQTKNEVRNLKQRRTELGREAKERRGQLRQLGTDIQQRDKTLEENQKQQTNLERSLRRKLKNINTMENESGMVEKIKKSGTVTTEEKKYVKGLRKKAKRHINKMVKEEEIGKG